MNKLHDIILSKNTPPDFICFSKLKIKLTYPDRNQKQGIMNEKTHEVINNDNVVSRSGTIYTDMSSL